MTYYQNFFHLEFLEFMDLLLIFPNGVNDEQNSEDLREDSELELPISQNEFFTSFKNFYWR